VTDNTFNIGDVVRCEREAPAKGTWSQYAGRVGRVMNPNNHGEVGLTWQVEPSARHDSVDSWFLPSELVLVRRAQAPRRLIQGPLP
jgi:hypothetical protein